MTGRRGEDEKREEGGDSCQVRDHMRCSNRTQDHLILLLISMLLSC
jgi:hypothetical protein